MKQRFAAQTIPMIIAGLTGEFRPLIADSSGLVASAVTVKTPAAKV